MESLKDVGLNNRSILGFNKSPFSNGLGLELLLNNHEENIGKGLVGCDHSFKVMEVATNHTRLLPLSYPNFVRGPLLDDMRPFFGPCEVLGIHH